MFGNDYKKHLWFLGVFTEEEHNGVEAVKKAYETQLKVAKEDVEDYAGLVIALNRKLWQRYDEGNMDMAEVYNDLRMQTHDNIEKVFKKKADRLKYYRIVD